jgi:2-polyprenyl-3-methyl-5-hydroxy-6-metoxy-1,4-benzoquinol methylase
MSKYSVEIDLSNENSSHTKIIRMIGRNKRVVEFGCAAGHMSRVLKEKFGCEVVGLEINHEDAKRARAYCSEVIIGDIDELAWCEELSGSCFDVAIFADVLEHLRSPETALERVRDILSEHGSIVVSVPNIANTSIRLELLLGGFEYEELGILDNTHLRHFTLKSIIHLIVDAGFYIDSVDYVVKDVPESIIRNTLKALDLTPTKVTIDYLSSMEAIAYQFIVRALIRRPKEYTPYPFKDMKKPERIVESYFQERAGRIEQYEKWLQDRDHLVEEQARQIEAKDAHIQDIESELNLIKGSKAWRMAELFRKLVYLRLLRRF